MNKICTLPFSILNCVSDTLYPCCSGWLKPEVKSIIKSKTASDIWFKDFKVFRDSILDGTYTYCRDDCPMRLDIRDSTIASYDKLPDNIKNELDKPDGFNSYPFELTLSYDITCNLKCKGCRKTVLSTTQQNIDYYDKYYKELIDNATTLRISGDGDAFASQYYFNLLKSDLTERCKNLKDIKIMTNGILFDEYHFNQIHENNKKLISGILISIDATTPDTYKEFRGGDFNKLIKNLKFIQELKSKYKFWIYSAYTVSKLNFMEVPDFIYFARDYGIDTVQIWELNDWGRGYSKSEYGIDTNSFEIYEMLEETKKRALEVSNSVNVILSIKSSYINQDKHYPINKPELVLDNNILKQDIAAIYCPFYISTDNNGDWIDKWISNVGLIETLPKFYTISYESTVNIELYNDVINKLNSIATCIGIYENIYHSDALSIAHDYLHKYGYSYMVHIEQDVILTTPIANHIINTLINEKTDVAITDISGNDYFLTDSDIDISIFAINLNTYDNTNYHMYLSSDNITENLLIDSHSKFNCGDCKTKPNILNNKSSLELYNLQNKLTRYTYNNNITHWIHNYLDEANIDNIINPVYIDTARSYPLHAYDNNKLSIIYGISMYAKHMRKSRFGVYDKQLYMNIDKIIKLYGYSPYNDKVNNTPYYSKGLDVVIISQNQKNDIYNMLNTLKLSIPTANRIFILDRCIDDSNKLLSKYNEQYIELENRIGFCAGSARNAGLKLTNPTNDVLFLDGDRIPHNLNIERIIQMLYYFDISVISHKIDNRKWFSDIPSINTNFNNYSNGIWSSAILLRRSAINKIIEIVGNDNLFDPIFDGNWGCEDEYLGDVAKYLHMSCGGFPNFIYVDGDTTIADKSKLGYSEQVEKRNKLRSNLFNIHSDMLSGNQPYLSKKERRELVNSIVSERRNVMRNMIKHRDRE